MLQINPISDDPTTDPSEDLSDFAVTHRDPVLGFARVIAQVKSNTRKFGGWGP